MPPPTPIKYAMMASALLASASTIYGIVLDGVYDFNEGYTTTSTTVNWFNDHSTATSIYTDPANQTTTIHYGFDDIDSPTYFFLYVEAPLYAKNMIWDDLGTILTAADLDPYRPHYSHHKDTFEKLTFSTALGSEKLVFLDDDFKKLFSATLGKSDNSAYSGLIDSKDSYDYILGKTINGEVVTDKLSLARDTPMSFEFKFAVDQSDGTSVGQVLVANALANGIVVHLSPERQADDLIPEPSTGMLGALGLMVILRRRNR